jgi:hypothetical protein
MQMSPHPDQTSPMTVGPEAFEDGLVAEMTAALVAAKREMWIAARHQWTLADFKNWAVIQQIDAALDKARKP